MAATAPALSPTPADGLSDAEAARRLAARPPDPGPSTRSVGQILRANTFTLFNAILFGFAGAMIAVGLYSDLLFLGVAIVNTAIGTIQEVRAKKQLDELALLVAPKARVVRSGRLVQLGLDKLVSGDLVRIEPGDQVVGDGPVLESRGLQVDESLLTGESEPIPKDAQDEVRSGAFCVAGSGTYVAERVGADAYASRLTSLAQAERDALSPLQHDINRLLRALLVLMAVLAVLLLVALRQHEVPTREAVQTAAAGLITVVPEGLVLLTSIAFAVGAARMARRGALVQRLNAVESLAGVDVVCVDKTGTLTDGALALEEVVPLGATTEPEARRLLGEFAASLGARNPTADAIATAIEGVPRAVQLEVPFSSRWKWSALSYADGEASVLGAPEALDGPASLGPEVQTQIDARARERLRVLVFCEAQAPLVAPPQGHEPQAPPLRALALVVLSERMRPGTADAIRFLRSEGVEVKVISGDGPVTVEAVARAAGMETEGRVTTGAELPDTLGPELEEAALANVVFARTQPEQKRLLVQALARRGRRVAMVGDGVNDVPALKLCDVSLALGSGSQVAKGVSDIVLVAGSFDAIPAAISEGRKILGNVKRVAKLFVSKSIFAATLVVTVGLAGEAYPFLPRQLSLAAAFTVGIPAFFLALAPPLERRPSTTPFLRDVMWFAVPAGVVTALAVLLGYGLVHGSLDRSLAEGQTTSVTILTLVGLYLVLVLESSALQRDVRRRRFMVLLVGTLAVAYVLVISLGAARGFFGLAELSPLSVIVSLLCTSFAIGALGAIGMSLTRIGGERPEWARRLRS